MTTENTTGTATDTGAQQAEETRQGQGHEQTQEQQEKTQGKGNVPYARFQEVVEQRKTLESTLTSIVEGLVGELPEDMRDLVPNLPPAEKVAWIKAAKERGLFDKGVKTDLTPSSSPDTKRPGGKQQTDLNGMTATEKLRFGFSQRK